MEYLLTEACQNSFILVDLLEQTSVSIEDVETIRKWLVKEARDDALILLNGVAENGEFRLRMLVLGPDGAFGEFCANGARAAGCYLYSRYSSYRKFFLTTSFGLHPLLKPACGLYSVSLPRARFQANRKFITNERHVFKQYGLRYVEVIEPHLVIEKRMEDWELLELGSQLNQQKGLFPLGINVNAWQRLDEKTLFVKTYERGVKRLTKSCGTGSLACAESSLRRGPLHIHTPGGILQVELAEKSITLEGPATMVKAGA